MANTCAPCHQQQLRHGGGFWAWRHQDTERATVTIKAISLNSLDIYISKVP